MMESNPERKHRLTPRGMRANRLRELGVPDAFVSTVKRINKRKDHLGNVLLDEDNAYYYLLTSDWDDLVGAEITPLATGSNGDTFYLAITRGDLTQLVEFDLEIGISERFGSFDDLIINILYGIAYDVKSDDEFMAVATELGYSGKISLSDMDI